MFSSSLLRRRRDGGWGWVVVWSVLMSQVLLGGICLSGGLFYVIFRNAFNSSPFETSWLCALPITVWFYSSPIGSFLTNRYGFRISSLIGGVIAAVGLCLGFVAPNFGFLFFSHGILTGMGFGINYTAGMAAVNVYFDKYKTIASGLCTIGHNAGLVIFSVFIVFLDEKYGWRGSLLIHGGIAFNMCLFALLLAPLDSDNDTKVDDRTKQVSEIDHEKQIHVAETDLDMNKEQKSRSTQKKSFLNCSLLRKPAFICFCVSNILVNTSQGIYILHLPSYSREIGFTHDDLGTVLTVYGISNIIGKVVFSVLGQHPKLDVIVLYMTSLVITGLCIGLTPVFITRVGMLTLAGLVGFFYCVTGALLAAVIFRIVGFERFADGVGMSMPFKASGNLIGGPIAGFLYSSTGDYSSSFYLGGACMVLGALVMILPIIKHHRDDRKLKQKNVIYQQEVEPLNHRDDQTLKQRHVIFQQEVEPLSAEGHSNVDNIEATAPV